MDIDHRRGDLAGVFLTNVKRGHGNGATIQEDAGIVFRGVKEEVLVRMIVPNGNVVGTQKVDRDNLVANKVIVAPKVHGVVGSIYRDGFGGGDTRIAQMS